MAVSNITFTYLNIRQSIVILCAKVVLIDILFAGVLIGFYYALMSSADFLGFSMSNSLLFLFVFITLGILKLLFDTYVVLQWLNEYYEITPEYIYHKKGIIFRKIEQYKINNIRAMDVEDSFFGQVFNFATITLYDIRLNKYLDMYLVHNPERYVEVLKELRPHIEQKNDHIRLPFLPKEGRQEVIEL